MGADLVHHAQVQLVDGAGFFQGRDEDARGNQPVDRVLPTGQGFETAEGIGQAPNNGLEIQSDPAFGNGFI